MGSNQTYNQSGNANADIMEQSRNFQEQGRELSNNVAKAGNLLMEIGCATSESVDLDQKAKLFEAALNEARMEGENGRKSGFEFVQEMENALANLVKENRLTFRGSLALSNSWFSSGLVPPECLSSTNDDFTKFLGSESSLNPEFVKNLLQYRLDRMPPESKDSPSILYQSFVSTLPSFPDSTKYEFVRTAVGMPEEKFADLGCSLLFENNETIRNAAIDGLSDRLDSGRLTSRILAQLTLIRSWLIDSGTISRLDQFVQKCIKNGFEITGNDKKFKHRAAYSSTVDGSGTQYIIVSTKIGNSQNLAMMLLKQGFGVKDAYLVPCQNKRHQVEMIERFREGLAPIETYEVPMEYVRQAVATALHQGAQSRMAPAPGLVECIEFIGLPDMRPEGGSVSDILATIDPEGKVIKLDDPKLAEFVEKSRSWPEKFSTLDHWFTLSDESDEILMSNDSDEVKWKNLYKLFSSRREFWSSCIVRMAMLLKSVKNECSDEFVAVAEALERDWDLEKIPVFETIISQTIRGWQYATGMAASVGELPNPSAETTDAEPIDVSDDMDFEIPESAVRVIKKILTAVNCKSEWLEGYFAGICTAPEEIKFTGCVEKLMERFQMNNLSVEEINTAMNSMLLVHNTILFKLIKGRAKEVLPSEDSELSEWATGYLNAWDEFPDCSTPEQLGQAGREIKTILESATKNVADPADFRKKVTEWMENQTETDWT